MNMKKKIIWRLANRPTPTEVIELNNAGLLTKDEAREILLTEETETTVSENSLKSEIKFLRELVEKLSKNSNTIIETIRYIEKPYLRQDWYAPYVNWCNAGSNNPVMYGAGGAVGINTVSNAVMQGTSNAQQALSKSFSSISTF